MKKIPKYAFGLMYFLRIFSLTIIIALFIVAITFSVMSYELKILISLIIVLTYLLYLFKFYKKIKNKINFELNKFLELSDIKGNEIVLDLGVGPGHEAIFLSKYLTSGMVIGLDKYLYTDDPFLTKLRFILQINYIGCTLDNAKRNAIIEGVKDKCKFIVGDYTEKLDFPDEYFDIICSRQSLYLIPHKKSLGVFQEIDRCLKKNGKIIIYESKKYKNWDILDAEDFFKKKGYHVELFKPRKSSMFFLYCKKV